MSTTKVNGGIFNKNIAYIIGIAQYQDPQLMLKTPVQDAQGIGQVLAQVHGFEVKYFLNATLAELRACFHELQEEGKAEDARLLVYFAGHGLNQYVSDGQKGFLIPADAVRGDTTSYLAMQELMEVLESIKSRHLLLVLDCCFAGSIKWSGTYQRDIGFENVQKIFRQYFDIYTRYKARQVLTSASHRQKALDRYEDDDQHSPFAQCLINALQGAADISKDGIISMHEIQTYLREHLLLPPESAHIQTSELFSFHGHQEGEFVFFLDGFNPELLTELYFYNPYKGLDAFEKEDNIVFFGRKKAISSLLSHVQQHPLTVVVGPSGAGKSSLVKAGLIPLLESQYTSKTVPVIRPGKMPLEQLASYLAGDFEYIVIDQWEELITQTEHPEDIEKFNAILADWLQNGKKIIGTVRSDFEPQLRSRLLERYWKNGRFLVPAFTADDYRQIIYAPARRVGCLFEPPELVDKIIEEVHQQPGALPLLSFLLQQLFEEAKKETGQFHIIKEAHYDTTGGVSGALQAKADAAYLTLPSALHQSVMKQLMLRMIALSAGEMAGKRVMRSELIFTTAEENEAVSLVINNLVEARLLVSADAYIEPAHDALVRAWGLLWSWVKEMGTEALFLLNKLSQDVTDYLRKPQEDQDAFLWHNNPRLEQVLQLTPGQKAFLNREELAFIEKSAALQVKEMEILRKERDEAIRQKLSAEKAMRSAQNLALTYQSKDPVFLARCIEYNYHHNPDNAAVTKAYLKLVHGSDIESYRNTLDMPDAVSCMACSANGQYLAVGLRDNSILLIDRVESNTIRINQSEERSAHKVTSLSFSKDNLTLFSGHSNFEAYSWHISGEKIQDFVKKEGLQGTINSIAFSTVHQCVITADQSLNFWTPNGKLLKTITLGNNIQKLFMALTPDENHIFAAGWDINAEGKWAPVAQLIPFDEQPPIAFNGHRRIINCLAISHDGTQIATGDYDGTVILWDLSGTPQTHFNIQTGIADTIAFSPDDQFLLTSCHSSGAVQLWNKYQALVRTYSGHEDTLGGALFLPDNHFIATGSLDKTIKIWQNIPIFASGVQEFESHITSVAWKDNYVFWGSWDGGLALWDIASGEIVKQEEVPYGQKISFDTPGKNVINLPKPGESNENTTKSQERKEIWGGTFCSDDRILYGSTNGDIGLWNWRENTHHFLKKGGDPTMSICLFSDKQHFLSGHKEKVVLWDISGQEIFTFAMPTGHNSMVLSLSPDDAQFLTAAGDTVYKWDMNGQQLCSFIGHTQNITSVQFSPDGQLVLTASVDKTAKLWTSEGVLLHTFEGHSDALSAAIFSPDQTSILTTGYDDKAKLWRLDGRIISSFSNPYQSRFRVCDYAPNGNYVVLGSDNGSILLASTTDHQCYEYSNEELQSKDMKLEPVVAYTPA